MLQPNNMPALPVRPPPVLAADAADTQTQHRRAPRPDTARSSTDPSPTASLLLHGHLKDRDTSARRNRSPYSRSHLRSRSSGAAPQLPPMTRAHSMPSPCTPRLTADSPTSATPSPMRTPARTRSPFSPCDDGAGIESIQEDSELDLRPRSQPSQIVQPTAMRASRVPSGGRRRPASPLSHTPFSPPPPPPTSHPADHQPAVAGAASSPSLAPQKYINEAYPQPTLHHHSSMSSMASLSSLNSFTSYPSTPTSARSRSPSISSLDTIEDEPEMEVVEEESEEEGRRRSSLDGGGRERERGFGFGRGRSEKKRWSVCGGERRADLDLETIWED